MITIDVRSSDADATDPVFGAWLENIGPCVEWARTVSWVRALCDDVQTARPRSGVAIIIRREP